MAKLKTLGEHNERVYQRINDWNKPHPNGIACPKCGKELWDSSPAITLASHPAQKYVHCPACGHMGFRLA